MGAAQTWSESLHWKLTLADKSLVTQGSWTCISSAPDMMLTDWDPSLSKWVDPPIVREEQPNVHETCWEAICLERGTGRNLNIRRLKGQKYIPHTPFTTSNRTRIGHCWHSDFYIKNHTLPPSELFSINTNPFLLFYQLWMAIHNNNNNHNKWTFP